MAAAPPQAPGDGAMSWYGNIAKVRIISQILATPGPLTVFDYGAGGGGGWAETLAQRPDITLYCFEPSSAVETLRRKAPQARILSEADLGAMSLNADFIVSFSVFEHVFDRVAYLANAKRQLGPNGSLFLNYDDGHFRKMLKLYDASDWPGSVREHLRNQAAAVLARLGLVQHYQKRVDRDEADRLVEAAGFQCVASRYENLSSFKQLAKHTPKANQAAFAAFWLATEDRLNADFDLPVSERFGDRALLWREMPSRTLLLRHR